MLNTAKMAKSTGGMLLGLHQVINRSPQRLAPVRQSRLLGLEAKNLSGSIQNPRTQLGRDQLGPCITLTMFTAAPVQVAGKTEVKVCAFSASYMTIPDGGVAEVAGRDDGVRNLNEIYGRGWHALYRFLVYHLAEEPRE